MGLTSNFLKSVLGVEGLTFQDLKDETYRKRFSHYLPWVTYDPQTKIYGCSDDSVGFIFECSPLAFAGEQAIETLEGLVRLNVPSGSVIQFTLLADPYIEPYLSAYKALKARDSDLTRTSAERFTQFLAEGREGLGKLNNIPVRDFRLIVSAKLPSGGSDVDLNDTRNTISEILSGANLFRPTWTRKTSSGGCAASSTERTTGKNRAATMTPCRSESRSSSRRRPS